MKLFSWIALGLMATTEASKYQSKIFENREKLPKNRSFLRDFYIKLGILPKIVPKDDWYRFISQFHNFLRNLYQKI